MSSVNKVITETTEEIHRIDPWITVKNVEHAHSGRIHYTLEKNGRVKKFFGSSNSKKPTSTKNFLQYVRQWAREIPDPATVGSAIEDTLKDAGKAALPAPKQDIQVPRTDERPKGSELNDNTLIDQLEYTVLEYGTSDLEGHFVNLSTIENRNKVSAVVVEALAERHPNLMRVEVKRQSTRGGKASRVLRFLTKPPEMPPQENPQETPKEVMPEPSESTPQTKTIISFESWLEMVDYITDNPKEFDGKSMSHAARVLSKKFGHNLSSGNLRHKKETIESRAKIQFCNPYKKSPASVEVFKYVDPLHLADCVDTTLQVVEDILERLHKVGKTDRTDTLTRKLEALHGQLREGLETYYEAAT